MSYEVLVDNLRAAAGDYETVADSLGSDGVEIDHVDPTSFGHVELAAWVKAIGEQCDKATKALHDGATGLGDSLDAAANHYETTDETIGTVFQSPFSNGSLLQPVLALRHLRHAEWSALSLPDGAELGSTTDPKALIKGEPSQVRANATRLSRRVHPSRRARRRRRRHHDRRLVGRLRRAGLRQRPHPVSRRSGRRTPTSCPRPSKSLSTYAGALTTAQSKAADAIKKWQEAEAASDKAVTDYNTAVDNYNAYVNRQVCVPSYGGSGPVTPSVGPGKPGPFVDPGDAMREEAQQILEDARTALDEAGMSAVEELGGLPGAKVETLVRPRRIGGRRRARASTGATGPTRSAAGSPAATPTASPRARSRSTSAR